MKSESFPFEVLCELTEEELADRAASCSKKLVELGDLQAAKKTTMANFAAKEKTLSDDIRRLGIAHNSKKDNKLIECIEVVAGSDKVSIMRCDTHEVVGERDMTEQEMIDYRQGKLFGMMNTREERRRAEKEEKQH